MAAQGHALAENADSGPRRPFFGRRPARPGSGAARTGRPNRPTRSIGALVRLLKKAEHSETAAACTLCDGKQADALPGFARAAAATADGTARRRRSPEGRRPDHGPCPRQRDPNSPHDVNARERLLQKPDRKTAVMASMDGDGHGPRVGGPALS
ncbi:uncharacterized protein A4U43_C02F7350 [Asparagus officinalis]|uniref:Uncharacterized protein n=1 Tax=Asparagus officinalis TaxID=4686 RepID=A0A5P1FHD8_ASPOF|nr:uncharacterized protein A4U43_C02F7350 [Asparagus officinalis]